MRYTRVILISMFLCLFVAKNYGQNTLFADKAVSTAIENNFDIKRSINATDIAKNNTSIYNTGELPTVTLSGGANLNIDNSNVVFQDGRETHLSWVGTQNASAAVTANYTIFNGFFRKYNIEQLSKKYLLSELQVEAAMENIAAQTLSQYYNIAALENSMDILKQSIEISQQRLVRAQTQVEFGQGNELDVLNAQVDLNNDSLNYQNASMQLENAKRSLNKLMVTNDNVDYQVSSDLDVSQLLDRNTLRQNLLNQNVQLEQMDRNIEIGNLSIEMVNAKKLPTVGASLDYGYAYNKFNASSFLASQNTNGLTAGLNLSWNLFDGSNKVAIQNAKLNVLDLQYQKEQLKYNLETDFDIAWANYQNSLTILETNQKNEELSRKNFERTKERFNAGQINSVDFRQAQLNLLNAQNGLISAQYDIKINETQLLLLSGDILD